MTFVPGCFKLQDEGILLGEHIGLLARDDTIVRAYYGGCTFDREFFDVLSVAEETQRQSDWKQHIEQSQRGRTGQPSPGDDSLKATPQE